MRVEVKPPKTFIGLKLPYIRDNELKENIGLRSKALLVQCILVYTVLGVFVLPSKL